MQVSTTLKKLRKAGACEDRYKHLKKSLGKGYGDDTPIDLLTILDTNGLEDVLWIPRSAVDGDYIERRYRLFAVACCQDVLHLMKDQRSLDAVKAAHLYAYDEIDDAAGAAAWAAAGMLGLLSGLLQGMLRGLLRGAAGDAWTAARAAARAAAGAAAWNAVGERQADHFRIIFSEDFNG
jgi:hypothetical protein